MADYTDRPAGIIRKRAVIGGVDYAKGARIKRAGEFDWKDATSNDTIYDNDEVRVAPGGSIRVRRRDRSQSSQPGDSMTRYQAAPVPKLSSKATPVPSAKKPKLSIKNRPIRQSPANTFPR